MLNKMFISDQLCSFQQLPSPLSPLFFGTLPVNLGKQDKSKGLGPGFDWKVKITLFSIQPLGRWYGNKIKQVKKLKTLLVNLDKKDKRNRLGLMESESSIFNKQDKRVLWKVKITLLADDIAMKKLKTLLVNMTSKEKERVLVWLN